MELEFRHLRIVIAVADEGSITRAAAALKLSQPSLTSQLQRIERELGAPLFDRLRTGVAPTAFGRSVLAKARAVLHGMAALRGEALPAADRPIRLRLGGFPGSLLSVVVPRLVGLPGTTAVHTDPSTAALLAAVRGGRLDAAVVADVHGFEVPPLPGVHRAVVVPREPRFVALPARHPLAHRPVIALADLAGEHWIVDPHEDHGGTAPLRAACRAAGFDPVVAHEISDTSSTRDFVRTGQGVCLAQPTATEGPGLVVRPLVGDPVLRRIDLVWTQPCPISPARLHRAVADAYVELTGRNSGYARWWAEHGAVAGTPA
ncbi:LysR family transcriptional regulator [Actinokineospora bangkokensis]|uniref:HTH lysR-type domain-containing protein n=1 Tax=Actinokineospora bangkokensis TaxID=1193682 RepID=A0A1Q9LH23_9PSEU|nr:LysR family transcriptional regulator [Actinokineospora bangkokensis]OLR91342.1 hypothetical protein BJP25_27140 [Actinokineospora bangkokensis]